jgi:PBSX family phage terminase large subunit
MPNPHPKVHFLPGNTAAAGPKNLNKTHELHKAILEELEFPVISDGTTNYQVYVRKVLEMAKQGHSKAIELVSDWTNSEGFLTRFEEYERRGMDRDLAFIRYQIAEKGHKVQQTILIDNSKRIVIMAGRQSGKTQLLKMKATQVLATIPEASVLYIGLTIETAIKLIYDDVLEMMKDVGLDSNKENRANGEITFSNRSTLHIKGNSSIEECNKLRGPNHDLVIIDECQSMEKRLEYLCVDIIEPELAKRNGKLIMTGTAPRVPGTFWEKVWLDTTASRYNFNIADNPFIPDYRQVLKDKLMEKGWSENNSTYQREWLGKVVYDTDALVYKLGEKNYYTDDSLKDWINKQYSKSDIGFVGGLDWGYEDYTSFVILAYSVSSPEKYILFQAKEHRKDLSSMGEKIKQGIAMVKNHPFFAGIPPERHTFAIYGDPGAGGAQANAELRNQWGLNIQTAIRTDKDLGIEQLQDWCNLGFIKVKQGTHFDEEAKRIVWKKDALTDAYMREIDDDVFHPEIAMSVLYSLRQQMKYKIKYTEIAEVRAIQTLSPAELKQKEWLRSRDTVALENEKRAEASRQLEKVLRQ